MNKGILIGIFAFVVLGVGGTAYLLSQQQEDEPAISSTTTSTDQLTEPIASSAGDSETAQTDSQYVAYSDEAFNNTKGTRILFFHAPWCPQCRQLDSEINANLSQLPEGVTVFRIDYDNNQAIRQKYGITIQTSFVKVDESGNLVIRYVAYDDPTYTNFAKNLL